MNTKIKYILLTLFLLLNSCADKIDTENSLKENGFNIKETSLNGEFSIASKNKNIYFLRHSNCFCGDITDTIFKLPQTESTLPQTECVPEQITDTVNAFRDIKWRNETMDHLTAKGYSAYYVSGNGDFTVASKDGNIYILEHRNGDNPNITNKQKIGYKEMEF